MGKDTKIAWCGHTHNGLRGCTWNSEGCDLCYAESMSFRNPTALGVWGPFGARPVGTDTYWKQLLAWNREAEAARKPATVFVLSLGDLFEGEPGVDRDEYARRLLDGIDAKGRLALDLWQTSQPSTRPIRQDLYEREMASLCDDAVLAEIRAWVAAHEGRTGPRADHLPVLARYREVFAACPWLIGLMLSKRPWNQVAYAEAHGWHNRWAAGCTAENQARLDERAPHLLKVPAFVHFLSVEPMLGPVDVRPYLPRFDYCPEEAEFELLPESKRPLGVETGCQGCPGTGKGECAAVMRTGVEWVISGCESKRAGTRKVPGRRVDIAWERDLRDQCDAADVPYFRKQADVNGDVIELAPLDGRVWDQQPKAFLEAP